jgi:hypothetical protein
MLNLESENEVPTVPGGRMNQSSESVGINDQDFTRDPYSINNDRQYLNNNQLEDEDNNS